MSPDILIKNGYILDGTGNPWFKANIMVDDGKIAKISKLKVNEAERVINAEGLFVSPGFIDVHSHADITLRDLSPGILAEPLANSLVRQGVTLFLGGNCGFSAAPGPGRDPSGRGDGVFSDFNNYFKNVEKKGVTVNVATLVGHGTLRNFVMGFDSRQPSKKEMEDMKILVSRSMKEGVFGLSTGLAYPPGYYANTDEVIELSKVVADYGGFYTSHIRGQGKLDFLPSIEEAIRIGEVAGVSVQISHIETHYDSWGLEGEVMKLIDNARARGVDVTCDTCSMVLGGMGLVNILPKWVLEGGLEMAKKILEDPSNRKKIMEDIPKASGNVARCIARDGHWEMFLILTSKKYPDFIGKTLADLMESSEKEPWDVLFDIIQEDEMGVRSSGHDEQDMRTALKHPTCSVETDAGILKSQDDPSKAKWEIHPRGGVTYPMIFRKYVRGETRSDLPYDEGTKLLTIEEAVKKMTGLPARVMGLKDRGLLMEDMFADIVIFDKNEIRDTATYEYPYLYPKGINYVMVNGQLVLDNGEHTGAFPGRIVKST